MNKWLIALLTVSLFSGCATVDTELQTKEKLLIGSGDNQQLVEFYKSNLHSVPEYKVKLVNLYLDMKDVKSAELYRNTYDAGDLDEPEYILTIARLNYQKKRFDKAQEELEKYRDEGGEEYEYQLLSGKILAQQKRFDEAIKHFEESRKQGASDREAGNNIAVVKMMQAQYADATDILYDLYLASPGDARVRSNLILASVNAERPDIALEVLKHTNNEQQARKQLAALMSSVSKNKGQKSTMRVADTPVSTTSLQRDAAKGAATSYVAPTSKVSSLATSTQFQPSQSSLDGSVLDPKKLKPGAPPTYRIQVLATYTAIPADYLNYLKSNYGTVYSYTHGLWKRYCVGDFNDLDQAKAFLESLDIKGAFVVDYTKKRYVRL
ncbi:tetratricopeptide repeat protein [Vibrio proteolyticus]